MKRPAGRHPGAAWALAAATVLAQITYPLVSGRLRDALTVATVVLFAGAVVAAAALAHGRAVALRLLVTCCAVGFGAEAVGVATGVPFGSYAYTTTLGPRLAGVPLVIPLAWTMMAYPALVVGRRIGAPVLSGALALATWDVFLDPQMVRAGHWHFSGGNGPRLNGIPVVNHLGWFAVAVVLLALLGRVVPRVLSQVGSPVESPAADAVPLALYGWTYASSLLANLAFFGRPAVALAGGVAMGVPVVLLVVGSRRVARLGRGGRRQLGPAGVRAA